MLWQGRKLLQVPQPMAVPVYNKAATYAPGFVSTIVPITQQRNSMAFLGQYDLASLQNSSNNFHAVPVNARCMRLYMVAMHMSSAPFLMAKIFSKMLHSNGTILAGDVFTNGHCQVPGGQGFQSGILHCFEGRGRNVTRLALRMRVAKGLHALQCRIKQAPGSDLGDYTFIFGEEAQPFLKSLAVSGTDFKFLGASAILPQDQTATTAPNSVFSASGFVSADGSATTAIVSTKVIHPSGPALQHAV